MLKPPVTVMISGAAGQIGYALLFRIASGQMFGQDTPVNLNLLELEAALPSLHGVAMELDDCAFPLLGKVLCTSDINAAANGANWVILVGAVPRRAGMERSDLLKINGSLFTVQGAAINAHAASDVRTFVVGNPCNTNCLIAMHAAPDVPRDRFYAMTMLDENRARSQLAIKAGMPVAAVQNMAIWGNHSGTQYPDFYNATINGKAVTDVISDKNWLENTFIPLVQQRGAEVIKARGASSAASAANGVVDSIYALTHDTPTDTCYSVARCSHGEYGVDDGLIFSFPSRTQGENSSIIESVTHTPFGLAKIAETLAELRQEKEAVTSLGLIKH